MYLKELQALKSPIIGALVLEFFIFRKSRSFPQALLLIFLKSKVLGYVCYKRYNCNCQANFVDADNSHQAANAHSDEQALCSFMSRRYASITYD